MIKRLTQNLKLRSSILLTGGIGLLPLIFLLFFFFFPLFNIFRVIFLQAVTQGFNSLVWVRLGDVLWFTIWQAGVSTLLTLIIGLPAAYLFGTYHFPGKKVLKALLMVPFILPTVVVAVGFNTLIGPQGWINIVLMRLFNLSLPPLQLLNSIWAILLAHVFYNTVVVLRVVGNGWAAMDIRLEQAARSLGASPWQAFWKVTLPMVRPYIFSAALLVFLFDFTSYGVVLLLGGGRLATLEVEIYIQAVQLLNLPVAGVMSLVQLAFTVFITWFYSRLDHKQQEQSGKGLNTEMKFARTIRQKILVWGGAILLTIFLLSPLMALSLRSVVRFEANRGEYGQVQMGVTGSYYQELFINRRNAYFYVPPIEAVANSLFFASLTVLMAVPLGTAATYVMKHNPKQAQWIDLAVMLPLGASAVTLGLGFLMAFNRPPLDVKNFPLLIPIVHSLVAFPFVVRVLYPAWSGLPSSLLQAASVLGASPWRVWREVELPMLIRPILAAVVFCFTISLGEFGATSFLVIPDKPTMPVAIYRYLSQPGALNYGQALAMATLLMLVCGLAIFAIELIQPDEQSGLL